MGAEGAAVAKRRIHADSLLDESDGALAAFLARNIAFAAVNAFLRSYDGGAPAPAHVQPFPGFNLGQRRTGDFPQVRQPFAIHILCQPGEQWRDDPVTVQHDGGADLDAAGADGEIFHDILPLGDAADSLNRHAGGLGDLRYAAQADRFDRHPGVAAERGMAMDRGQGFEGVDVHSHQYLHGVDCRDGIGAGCHDSPGDILNVAGVRRQFDHDRNADSFLHTGGDGCRHGFIFADGRPHIVFQPEVRAREIQLECVSAGFFHSARQVLPGFAIFIRHDAGDDAFAGKLPLQIPDRSIPIGHRFLREPFDVFKSGDVAGVVAQGGETVGDIGGDQVVGGAGFGYRAGPAQL